jgi:para-nitrobenzyl esterase
VKTFLVSFPGKGRGPSAAGRLFRRCTSFPKLPPLGPGLRRGSAAITAALLCAAASSASTPPQVAVTGGTIEGKAAPDGTALVFQGLPFAAPPTAENRWKPPQPVLPWSGVLDATQPAPACVQNDFGWNEANFVYSSEDCLTLDIRTPALTGKRPVMVWIHGGSNRAGGAGGIVQSRITDHGVVLVAIQYRLGIFGFLSHRGLAAEQGGDSGNYGLMDQIAALKWVQANIAEFGGDPDNVTIFGESAGSQDVSLLLAAPSARGLFDKAILESGTPGFGLPFRPLDAAFRLGDQIDALLDTGGDVEKLRDASIPALLAADLKLHDPAIQDNSFVWLHTTIDGAVLPKSPRALLAEAPPRPVIVGTNRTEFGYPGGRPHRDAFIDRAFEENADEARAFYHLDQPDPPADPRLGDRDLVIGTDAIFRCPANALASLLAKNGAPVWRYEFDLAPDGGRTSHAAEIAWVLGEKSVTPDWSLQDYWASFAKDGNADGPTLPDWPRWTASGERTMLFDTAGATPKAHLRSEICNLMDRL